MTFSILGQLRRRGSSVVVVTLWSAGVLPLSGQRVDVPQTITQTLARHIGASVGGYVMPELRLSDDSTDVFVRGFMAVDHDGEWGGGFQVIGYFELPRPAQIPEGDDFYGEARLLVVGGNQREAIDVAILASTSALVDYDGWGLIGTVEVGALQRSEPSGVKNDVKSASISLQAAAWQQLSSLLGRVAYRWTRFPARLPDPRFFQAGGKTQYHDLSLDLTSTRVEEVTLRFGHRFGVPGGTWVIAEINRHLSDRLLLSLSGGRQPGAPELSMIWGEFVSVGLKWRSGFGGAAVVEKSASAPLKHLR